MNLRAYQTVLLLPRPTQAAQLHTHLRQQLSPRAAHVTRTGNDLHVTFGDVTFDLHLREGGTVPAGHGLVAAILGLGTPAQHLTLSGEDDPDQRAQGRYLALTRALRHCLPGAVFFPAPAPRALQA